VDWTAADTSASGGGLVRVPGARDARSLAVAVVHLDPAGSGAGNPVAHKYHRTVRSAPHPLLPAWGGADGSTSTHRLRSSRPAPVPGR
jgi:hypothetical protein